MIDTRGVNYYIKKEDGSMIHIGKSSYGGLFCWDCKASLVIGGIKNINEYMELSNNCPICGNKYRKADTLNSITKAAYFEKKPIHRGITEILSFRWAIEPYHLGDRVKPEELLAKLLMGKLMDTDDLVESISDDKKEEELLIVDEYDREYSVGEFREYVLNQAPIQFFSIGQVFC